MLPQKSRSCLLQKKKKTKQTCWNFRIGVLNLGWGFLTQPLHYWSRMILLRMMDGAIPHRNLSYCLRPAAVYDSGILSQKTIRISLHIAQCRGGKDKLSLAESHWYSVASCLQYTGKSCLMPRWLEACFSRTCLAVAGSLWSLWRKLASLHSAGDLVSASAPACPLGSLHFLGFSNICVATF